MRKKILLCLFMITSIFSSLQSANGDSWNWYSWKILVPAAIVAGTAYGAKKFHDFNKKAGVNITDFTSLNWAFVLYVSMQASRFFGLRPSPWKKRLEKTPVPNQAAIYMGLHVGTYYANEADRQKNYKRAHDTLIENREKIRRLQASLQKD